MNLRELLMAALGNPTTDAAPAAQLGQGPMTDANLPPSITQPDGPMNDGNLPPSITNPMRQRPQRPQIPSYDTAAMDNLTAPLRDEGDPRNADSQQRALEMVAALRRGGALE